MKVLRIRAEGVPELGDVDLVPGDGIVGWTGDAKHSLRRFTDLVQVGMGMRTRSEVELANGTIVVEVRGERQHLRGEPPVVDRVRPSDLALLWTGGGWDRRGLSWEEAVRFVAELRGMDRIDECLRRLGAGAVTPEPVELSEIDRSLEALAEVPARSEALESELASLRADATEAAGDLEVATMEWLRERQDAETTLQAYRDRARELRGRIEEIEDAGPDGSCPFCGRPLGEHQEDVLRELRDEWEGLVQDGTWWRRRRLQLETKPPELRELERRSVGLHSAVEACAERLERCRFDLRRRDELRARRGQLRERLGIPGVKRSRSDGPDGRTDAALARIFRGARREMLADTSDHLGRRAGALLNRMTGGRILGLHTRGGEFPEIVEDGRRVPLSSDEDRAALAVSIHLAAVGAAVEAGVPIESILLADSFGRMDRDTQLRSVELLRDLQSRIPQILVLASGLADDLPNEFDRVLEFAGGSATEPGRLRVVAGGLGVLEIA